MANWNSSAWKVGLPADQLAKVEELESELENYRKDGRDRQLQVWKSSSYENFDFFPNAPKFKPIMWLVLMFTNTPGNFLLESILIPNIAGALTQF